MADTYLAVYVSNRGRMGLRWSLPFANPKSARDYAKAKVDAGEASISFAVAFDDGRGPGRIMRAYPESAEKMRRHYEDALALIANGPPA